MILDSVKQTETDVTNYCDWSNATEEFHSRVTWPVVPVALVEKSVENLERAAKKT